MVKALDINPCEEIRRRLDPKRPSSKDWMVPGKPVRGTKYVPKQTEGNKRNVVYNFLHNLQKPKGMLLNHKIETPSDDDVMEPHDAIRQVVPITREVFYVYSAFLERRKEPAVRVIGATYVNPEKGVFCLLRLRDNRTYVAVAKIKVVEEHHDSYYGAVFILCLLKNLKPDEAVGGSVSVMSLTSRNHVVTNRLPILDTKPKSGGQENIHVCVRPLHYSYNDVDWMVEWIEFNRILGVTHFYFYNMSIGDNIDCMLRNYPNNEKLFTVLEFDFSHLNLWMEGQQLSAHDCLYRSASKADWLLLIDLDEVVLPHHKGLKLLQKSIGKHVKLYPELFSLLSSEVSPSEDPYEFQFRNAFFYQAWDDDPKSILPLYTAKKTRRSTQVDWYGVRSKYAVRPSKAVELAIHFVSEFDTGDSDYNTFQVEPDVALLHHYRTQCAEVKCYLRQSMVDRSAHRWSGLLWKRVQKRLKQIDKVCPVIDTMETV
ncbi:glycosyltransferase family 92 domain-containing protein [Phthorimaea operculella]|nr:glycosyltransferase family 92 domain-containing protein [Phthorimaea operculella]